MFEGWTHGEFIALVAAAGGFLAACVSAYNTRKIRDIHIMINSRMAQMLSGAQAEGRQYERADQEQRNRAQEVRSDSKNL